MTFPQPDSNSPTIQSQGFFRLNQTLVSPGDTYQSEQSGVAYAVGPDSDIARIQVNYYDPSLAPTFMNQVIVSNRAPFVGLIAARNDQNYQPSNVQGRVLFSPADLVPNLPAYSFGGAASHGVMVLPPVMDIIQFFDMPEGGIPTQRNDRQYALDLTNPGGGAGSFALWVPCYGRNLYQVTSFDEFSTGADLAIDGLNFGNDDFANPMTTPLKTATAVGTSFNQVFYADTSGQFDYLAITMSVAAAGTRLPVRIRLSDTQ